MSHELMYTSVPKGLRPGSMGYCTVAVTQNCPSLLQEKLENLSGYRHLFSPFDLNAKYNPVCLQHVRMNIGGKTYSILSSITDAGIDYSKRSNKFAHHVALEASECPSANPAWSLAQPEFLQRKWDGEPRTLPSGRPAPSGGTGAGVAHTWKQLTGDAGLAGVLAQAFLQNPGNPYYLVFDPGTSVLPLFVEAIALLPREKQWQVTFSTYYQSMSADVQCAWRAVARHSPEAQQAISRKLPLIDLASAGTAPEGDLVHLARTGERLQPASKPAAQPKSSPSTPVPLPATFAFAGSDDDDPPSEEAPIPLPRPKKPARKQMSLKTFDEKMIERRTPDEEEQPRSKLPLIIAAGIFLLLLLFGGIVAIVVSLPGGQKDQAQASKPEANNNGPGKQGPDGGQQKGGPGEAAPQGAVQQGGPGDPKGAEQKQGLGRNIDDGSLNALEKREAEKKNQKQNEPDPGKDKQKEPDKGAVPDPNNMRKQFGTGPDKVDAPPPVVVNNGNPPKEKSGFKTVDEGNAPPAGNAARPIIPVAQPEYIPVIYHKLPEGPPGNENQTITLMKPENGTSSFSFLHDGPLKGQVFVPTRDGAGYLFETVENPRRNVIGPIVVGRMQNTPGGLIVSISDLKNQADILRYLRANPILSESFTKKMTLHVFVDDPARFSPGTMPFVLQVDRSKWPKLSKSGVEPDRTVHQKIDRININWFKQMKSNWADEINSNVEAKVVMGNADSIKYFVPSKGELPCPEGELRRKAKELRLNLSVNPNTLETTASYTLSYDGKKPPLFQDNDKEATTKSKQSELDSLIKEADGLSPTRIELYDVKYVLTVNGKSFLMWQNKPTPASAPSAPHGLDASGVSKQ